MLLGGHSAAAQPKDVKSSVKKSSPTVVETQSQFKGHNQGKTQRSGTQYKSQKRPSDKYKAPAYKTPRPEPPSQPPPDYEAQDAYDAPRRYRDSSSDEVFLKTPDQYSSPPPAQYTAPEEQYSPTKEQYRPAKKQYSLAKEHEPPQYKDMHKYDREEYSQQYSQAESRYDDQHDYYHHQSYYNRDYEPHPNGKPDHHGPAVV